MKVLLFSHIQPPATDGGSKVIYKLGQYFQSHGHTTKFVSSNCYSTDDFTHKTSKHSSKGLPVITIFHKPFKLLSKLFPVFKPLAKGPIFSPLPFLLELISIIKFKPDVIVAGPLPTTTVLYACFIKLLIPSAKLLINASFHPTDPDFHSFLLINALKSADYIWTLTDYETKYFYSKFNIPYSKMINVGNGIDRTYLSKNSKRKTLNSKLIFIGSLSAHKGIKTLINAYSLLETPQKLYICGQKTLYYPQIKNMVENFPHQIILKTNLTDNQIKKLLDKSSLLILPSSQESFGLVLLEAWARGIPVITSDIPQLSELINKSEGGLTFNLGDHLDLTNKINQILNSQNLYSKLSENGYNYASSHTWDKIGDSLCQKIGFY